MTDLALGRTISLVDLSDPDRPRVTQRIQSFKQPTAVSINAAGTLVAVCFDPKGSGKTIPLAIYRLNGGRLSAPVTPAIPGWTAGDTLLDVQWHPRQNVLALLNKTKPALSFVRVTGANGQLRLSSWGNRIGIDKEPFRVLWTPDARFALVNSSEANTVLSVRVGTQTAGGAISHRVVSRAKTGTLPEGLCISPNGRWVVTTNLEHSYEPSGSPKRSLFSSLTLFRFNPATGALKQAGTFAFDGMLPESAVFDNSSRFLAVTNYSHFDPNRKGGTLDFWRLAESAKRLELVKMDFSVPVSRGPQTMTIAR